jgi:hypothetical protein
MAFINNHYAGLKRLSIPLYSFIWFNSLFQVFLLLVYLWVISHLLAGVGKCWGDEEGWYDCNLLGTIITSVRKMCAIPCMRLRNQCYQPFRYRQKELQMRYKPHSHTVLTKINFTRLRSRTRGCSHGMTW